MTGLPRQGIGLCVRDSQIQMVLFDDGIGCQNTIPRDACFQGRSQVIDRNPCAFYDWHATQDLGISRDKVACQIRKPSLMHA